MVRALGRRGIPVAVATAAPGSDVTRSRYCRAVVGIPDVVDDPAGAVRAIVAWARRQPQAPVLFYQGDHDLQALSRHRDEIAPHVRCLLPPADLVEDCVDKLRFAALAARLSLPVPDSRLLHRGSAAREIEAWNCFPCVLKPAVRTRWSESPLMLRAGSSGQKVLHVRDRAELAALVPLMDGQQTDFVLQAYIAGGEDCIVSYHAYIRPGGETVAEFTGRKLRTAPRRYGLSTYVEITDDPAVKEQGRTAVQRLRLSGVVKMDFKQDERDGRLHLLEVNPRFNLWHHAGSLAGVCLPELVYRDCLAPGSARPARAVRPGVRWLKARDDRRALARDREPGDPSLARWLWQAATATVNEDLLWRDPRPALAHLLGTAKQRLLRALRGAAAIATGRRGGNPCS
jgi:predicted ATP-grasp superfamily ATP-dependent carboligase